MLVMTYLLVISMSSLVNHKHQIINCHRVKKYHSKHALFYFKKKRTAYLRTHAHQTTSRHPHQDKPQARKALLIEATFKNRNKICHLLFFFLFFMCILFWTVDNHPTYKL